MHTPHVQRAYHRVTGSVYDEMAGMGEDGGVNNAESCVSVPHSINGPCFQDLGLPLTASKIKANILKSPFCSDVV